MYDIHFMYCSVNWSSPNVFLQDPIRVNCRIIASRTGDDAHVATREKGGQSKVKAVRMLLQSKYVTCCYSDLHGT